MKRKTLRRPRPGQESAQQALSEQDIAPCSRPQRRRRSFPADGDLEQSARDAGTVCAYELHLPNSDRARYHHDVHKAFASIRIGMCTLACTNTFPLWDSDTGEWRAGLRAAIGLSR